MSIRGAVSTAVRRLIADGETEDDEPEGCVVCCKSILEDEQTVEHDGRTAHRHCVAALQRGARFLQTRGDQQ